MCKNQNAVLLSGTSVTFAVLIFEFLKLQGWAPAGRRFAAMPPTALWPRQGVVVTSGTAGQLAVNRAGAQYLSQPATAEDTGIVSGNAVNGAVGWLMSHAWLNVKPGSPLQQVAKRIPARRSTLKQHCNAPLC